MFDSAFNFKNIQVWLMNIQNSRANSMAGYTTDNSLLNKGLYKAEIRQDRNERQLTSFSQTPTRPSSRFRGTSTGGKEDDDTACLL